MRIPLDTEQMLEIALPNYHEELLKVEEIAISGFFLGMGVKYGAPDYFLNRYPPKWSKIYEDNNYFFGDPIVAWTFAREGSTRWSENGFPDIRGIMKHAAKFDLKYGATFSTKVKGKKSFLSVSRHDRELNDVEMNILATKLEAWANAFAGLNTALTDLELDALRVWGDGNKHQEAADLLGISVSALKLRLDSSRRKLGVRNAVAAVRRATRMNLI